MKTIDIKFADLCDEIDYWKDQADKYKELYERELQERAIASKKSLIEAQEGVANALMFALSVTDDKDGNLVMSKENRKEFAKNYKK
jgi:hypothetical protein